MDHLSRNDEVLERLKACEWDLVVVDEAHRMSAHYEGEDVRVTPTGSPGGPRRGWREAP